MKIKKNRITRKQLQTLQDSLTYNEKILHDHLIEQIFKDAAESAMKETLLRVYLLGIQTYKFFVISSRAYIRLEENPTCLFPSEIEQKLEKLNEIALFDQDGSEKFEKLRAIKKELHESGFPVVPNAKDNYVFLSQMRYVYDLYNEEFDYPDSPDSVFGYEEEE